MISYFYRSKNCMHHHHIFVIIDFISDWKIPGPPTYIWPKCVDLLQIKTNNVVYEEFIIPGYCCEIFVIPTELVQTTCYVNFVNGFFSSDLSAILIFGLYELAEIQSTILIQQKDCSTTTCFPFRFSVEFSLIASIAVQLWYQ